MKFPRVLFYYYTRRSVLRRAWFIRRGSLEDQYIASIESQGYGLSRSGRYWLLDSSGEFNIDLLDRQVPSHIRIPRRWWSRNTVLALLLGYILCFYFGCWLYIVIGFVYVIALPFVIALDILSNGRYLDNPYYYMFSDFM